MPASWFDLSLARNRKNKNVPKMAGSGSINETQCPVNCRRGKRAARLIDSRGHSNPRGRFACERMEFNFGYHFRVRSPPRTAKVAFPLGWPPGDVTARNRAFCSCYYLVLFRKIFTKANRKWPPECALAKVRDFHGRSAVAHENRSRTRQMIWFYLFFKSSTFHLSALSNERTAR